MNAFLSAMQDSCALFFHFIKVKTCDSFKNELSILAQEVKYFIEWMMKINVPAARGIYKIMEQSADTGFNLSEKSKFGRSPNPVLKEIETENGRQVLRA